jgi:hypothetical protein
MIQSRWFCKECNREWLSNSSAAGANPNPENNCFACGSPEIQLVEYDAPMPGLDIPRSEQSSIPTVPIAVDPIAVDPLPIPTTLLSSDKEESEVFDLSDMD